VILDPDGVERARIEGYLAKREFQAQLEMGLARLAFMSKRWDDAERRYGEIVDRYGETPAAAEAMYWRGVSRYQEKHDAGVLASVAAELKNRYHDSVWTEKASVWSH
jgi:TolA-binding protein